MQESADSATQAVTSFRLAAPYIFVGLFTVAAAAIVDFSPLHDLSIIAVLLIVPGSLIGLLARAYCIAIPLRTENIVTPRREWLGIAVHSFLVDHVLPMKSGLALRAVYFKWRHGLPYAKFIGLQGGANHIGLMTTAAFGSILLTFRILEYPRLAALYSISLCAFAVLLLGKPISSSRKNRFIQAGVTAYNSFSRLTSSGSTFFLIVSATLIVIGANVFALYFAFRCLGSPAGLYAAAAAVAGIRLSTVVSLTPSNLGIQELVTGIIASQFGATFDDGVLASLLARTVSIVLMLVIAPLSAGILTDLRLHNGASACSQEPSSPPEA